MALTDLTADKTVTTQIAYDAKNKVHVQTSKATRTILGSSGGDNNPLLIARFPEVVIQANKSFTIDTHVKAFVNGWTGDTEYLGLNVATNIKIDGEWYSLGNSGRTTAANRGGAMLTSYGSKKYVDFDNLIDRGYVQTHVAYPVQVELVGSCHADAQISINFNISGGTAIPHGSTAVTSVDNQNFVSVIIEETD